jgi:hypothetical protein
MSVTIQGYKTGQDVYIMGGSANAVITGSDVMQPVDIQSHYSQTIQTHTASVVPPSSWNGPLWIDTNGFSEIAVTFLNDAATTSSISIEWSNDGTTKQGTESVAPNGAFKERVASVPTKARYARVAVWNGDTVAHTISTWAYLKA